LIPQDHFARVHKNFGSNPVHGWLVTSAPTVNFPVEILAANFLASQWD
jgi:hypothetical protein